MVTVKWSHDLPTLQVSEVGSPIVSSTSNHELEASGHNSNIGSIITMLIDDQNVSIDEILSQEHYRQDNCSQQQQTTAQQQPKIKEEVESVQQMSDYAPATYQSTFGFPGEYRSASSISTWSETTSEVGVSSFIWTLDINFLLWPEFDISAF